MVAEPHMTWGYGCHHKSASTASTILLSRISKTRSVWRVWLMTLYYPERDLLALLLTYFLLEVHLTYLAHWLLFLVKGGDVYRHYMVSTYHADKIVLLLTPMDSGQGTKHPYPYCIVFSCFDIRSDSIFVDCRVNGDTARQHHGTLTFNILRWRLGSKQSMQVNGGRWPWPRVQHHGRIRRGGDARIRKPRRSGTPPATDSSTGRPMELSGRAAEKTAQTWCPCQEEGASGSRKKGDVVRGTGGAATTASGQ